MGLCIRVLWSQLVMAFKYSATGDCILEIGKLVYAIAIGAMSLPDWEDKDIKCTYDRKSRQGEVHTYGAQ